MRRDGWGEWQIANSEEKTEALRPPFCFWIGRQFPARALTDAREQPNHRYGGQNDLRCRVMQIAHRSSISLCAFYKIRPKADVLQLIELGPIVTTSEFPLKIIRYVRAIVDYVRLIN